MKLTHKASFLLVAICAISTAAKAVYMCCSLDTVALCGDECCKTECDSDGRCSGCAKGEEWAYPGTHNFSDFPTQVNGKECCASENITYVQLSTTITAPFCCWDGETYQTTKVNGKNIGHCCSKTSYLKSVFIDDKYKSACCPNDGDHISVLDGNDNAPYCCPEGKSKTSDLSVNECGLDDDIYEENGIKKCCSSGKESEGCCKKKSGNWKNGICCSTTESNKTIDGTDNTSCGCVPTDYSESCCEENGGIPSHRMNVPQLDFLCCRSDGKTMQGETVSGCCTDTQTLIADSCCDNTNVAEHHAEKECCSGSTLNKTTVLNGTDSYCCPNDKKDFVTNQGKCCSNSATYETDKDCFCAKNPNDSKCSGGCETGYKKCWNGSCVATSSCCPDENPSLYAGYSWNCNECTSSNTGSTSTWQLKSDYQKCSDGACAYKTYVGGVFYGGCCSDSDCTSQNDDYYCYFCEDYLCRQKYIGDDKSCCESKGKKWCAETENYSGQCVEQTECCPSEKPTCMYFSRQGRNPEESSIPYECSGGSWSMESTYKNCSVSGTCTKANLCCPDPNPAYLHGDSSKSNCRKCTDSSNNVWSFDSDTYKMCGNTCVYKYECCSDSDCSSDSSCGKCNQETHQCEYTYPNYAPYQSQTETEAESCCTQLGGHFCPGDDGYRDCKYGNAGCCNNELEDFGDTCYDCDRATHRWVPKTDVHYCSEVGYCKECCEFKKNAEDAAYCHTGAMCIGVGQWLVQHADFKKPGSGICKDAVNDEIRDDGGEAISGQLMKVTY